MFNSNEDLTSIPSEIDEDEWGEIQRYQIQKYWEEKKKQKFDSVKKKLELKNILDKQLQEKNLAKKQQQQEKQIYERDLLANC